MRTFMKWALVLLVPAVFGATGQSAEDDSIPKGTTVKLLLLRQKSVQKELKLSSDVIKKILEFTDAQSEAAGKAVKLEEGARRKAFEKLVKENEKFLTDNLDEKQSKRLNQITLQFTALTQLTKAETAKELELKDDQVKKLKELQTESRKALVELMESKEAKGKNEKFAKWRETTRKKILDLLTDDQKKKVREMAGEPFEGEIVFEEHPSKDK
jgi:hypothetical protein